jgi:hypothetical protein
VLQQQVLKTECGDGKGNAEDDNQSGYDPDEDVVCLLRMF